MSYARWAPDSRRVITISEFNIRMTIWSLIDRSTTYINYPKYSDKGVSFTSNGYFMALAERKESKDYIGIYYVGDWTLVSHFAVDSYDLQDICWTKDNTAIIVWDSMLECKFFIYSPTGNLISQHEAYQLNLGIKGLNMSPNGHYLTVGYYDQAVRIFNHITWKLIIDFMHPTSLNDSNNINIFREEEVEEVSYAGDLKKSTKYVDIKAPIKFNVIKPSIDKHNPSIGISEMKWSFDSNFLATRNGKKFNKF
jgi:WD40 repeat protein